MTKTRRMMEEDLKLVDAVCEILDARIPISSRNPDIDAICGKKPRMVILNRIDMADAGLWSARWSNYFKDRGMGRHPARTASRRKGINHVCAGRAARCWPRSSQRYAEKGQVGPAAEARWSSASRMSASRRSSTRSQAERARRRRTAPASRAASSGSRVDRGLLLLLDTPRHPLAEV